MANAIELETAEQVFNILQPVIPINHYLPVVNTAPAREVPYLLYESQIQSELVGVYSGIFQVRLVLTYTAKANSLSSADFDTQFQEILEQLYRNPSLSDVMTTASPTMQFYIADIVSVSPVVTSRTRTWSKVITIEVKGTTK